MCQLFRHAGADYLGAVWHLQCIGHMAGRRCIQDRLGPAAVGIDIQYFRDQDTAADSNGLTRFQIYLYLMTVGEFTDCIN